MPTQTTAYAPNRLNQYQTVGGTAFGYSRGNLTSDGVRTLGYDLENHLTSVSGPASLALAYDPLGRLKPTVSAGATVQFLYSGSDLVAEYDGSGTLLRRYVPGIAVDGPVVAYEGTEMTNRSSFQSPASVIM